MAFGPGSNAAGLKQDGHDIPEQLTIYTWSLAWITVDCIGDPNGIWQMHEFEEEFATDLECLPGFGHFFVQSFQLFMRFGVQLHVEFQQDLFRTEHQRVLDEHMRQTNDRCHFRVWCQIQGSRYHHLYARSA